MQFSINFLVALLATSALAAPTLRQKSHSQHSQNSGTFKVPSRARPNIPKNIDTRHEMSKAFAKFDFDLILPNIDGLSTTISVPDVPDVLSALLGGVQQATSTKAAKSKTSKAHKQTSVLTAASSAAPYTYPASSIAPETTSDVVYSSAAPETSATPEPIEPTSTPASTSWYQESSTESVVSSTETPSSVVVETSSAVPESTAPAETSAAPESSVIATSAVPETSSAAAVSSETPTTFSSVISPSFTFAPSTTEASSTIASTTSSTKVAATVNASPESNDSEYLSPVTIGGQALNLDFDTGSADLWVFSSSLSAAQIGGHAVFDPTKSSTWKPADGYSWKISYGDGSTASGGVGFDAVTIGGATATSQAVEIATQVSTTFANDTNNDGLVGLGWSSINTIKPTAQKTFFENIMDSLDQPLFTADLRTDSSGSYEFGTINPAKHTGDIHYTSIDNSKGFWEFPSTSYSINGQVYQNANAAPAIADTGTSIILADATAVAAYYNQVSGASVSSTAGGYIYPCTATLPDYGVAIGDSGFTAVVPGKDVTYAALGDGTCFGGIQSNAGINYQIFGDVLLKQYFAVFNGGAKTFGIATKA